MLQRGYVNCNSFYSFLTCYFSSGDGAKPFALQFGTISPGIVNGLQVNIVSWSFLWTLVFFFFCLLIFVWDDCIVVNVDSCSDQLGTAKFGWAGAWPGIVTSIVECLFSYNLQWISLGSYGPFGGWDIFLFCHQRCSPRFTLNSYLWLCMDLLANFKMSSHGICFVCYGLLLVHMTREWMISKVEKQWYDLKSKGFRINRTKYDL